MQNFPAKSGPSAEKLRGGYYTPDAIASFTAEWVAEAGPRLLEPSCGDGAILKHLVRAAGPSTIDAIELNETEARKARKANKSANVVCKDFFEWFTPDRMGSYDGVAGNPPYIRFGSWDEASRERALELMRREGLRPTKLTNAWVPFVVASLTALREGGRVGLVLPAELLQVSYSAQVRSYLAAQCSSLNIVAFQQLVFPGILQEVVVLLAERGPGPASIRTVEVANETDLVGVNFESVPSAHGLIHDEEKWTKYFLDGREIELLRRLRTENVLATLATYAQVDVGVVSGRNSFFCLSAAEAERLGIESYTLPLVSRSNQVPHSIFTSDDLETCEGSDARTRILALDATSPVRRKPLSTYLAMGTDEGVHEGYKCSIRKNWWQVPSLWVPDGFMLRQISTNPRIIANETNATSTDTVHRVRMKAGTDPRRLATAALNSASFAFAEVLGRSYGGGILELEPTEAEALPIPDPALVTDALVQKTDELLRDGRHDEARQLVDTTLLVEGCGLSEDEVAMLTSAWSRLHSRRSQRGRRSQKPPAPQLELPS